MAKIKEPSVEEIIKKLRAIGPSKWKRIESVSNSYGCYATELSGLMVDIDRTGNSYNNASNYTLQIYGADEEGGITYREGGITYLENDLSDKDEISKFYQDLVKKIITYRDRVSTRRTNSGRKKTLDKLLKVLKE